MGKLAYSKPSFTDGVKPTVAVSRARFVGGNGNQLTVAGAKARGISVDGWDPTDLQDAAGKLNIVILGIAELEAGGVVAPLARVTSDTSGRGVTVAVDQAVNAIALNDANTATGDYFPVLIIDGYESPADTAGATLANLEIEVNKLKAAFRSKLSKP